MCKVDCNEKDAHENAVSGKNIELRLAPLHQSDEKDESDQQQPLIAAVLETILFYIELVFCESRHIVANDIKHFLQCDGCHCVTLECASACDRFRSLRLEPDEHSRL